MAGVRRTWDKDFYEKRARDRAEQGDDYVEGDSGPAAKMKRATKEEFRAAEDGAAGPAGSQRAFLKSRTGKIDLEEKVGKIEVINPTSAGDLRGAGFWCETCSCLLKDSASYLDHINGKKRKRYFRLTTGFIIHAPLHMMISDQRALGFSMRVERADVDTVKSRLEALKKSVAAKSAAALLPKTSAIDEYDSRLRADLQEKEALKQKLKKEAEQRKKEKEEEKKAQTEAENGEEDGEFAAMMGFKGFGSTKK
jgi:U4/U6.U5 tri-snRNP component SNU23